MSKKNLLLSCIGSILFGSATVVADPLIAIPPGNMGCNVVITSHMGSPLPDPSTRPDSTQLKSAGTKSMKTAVVVRVGKVQHSTLTWSDGDTSDAWTLIDSGLTLAEKTTGPTKFIYELPQGSPMRNVVWPTLLDLDVNSLSWITPQTQVPGKTAYHGNPAIHYQTTKRLAALIGPPVTVLYQAWVQPKTLTLLALDDGNALYELTFFIPPPDPLVLPARFQKDLQHYQNANATPTHG